MKKEYVKPEMELVELITEVITISGETGSESGLPEGWV